MMDQASGLFVLWMVLHFIFGALFLFGFVAALVYVSKHVSKKDLKSIVWTTLLVGFFGSLVTCAILSKNMDWKERMMMDWDEDEESEDLDQ